MDIKKYLDRINYSGSKELTISILNELQKHHLLSITFENLDIHYGKKIELDQEKL